MGDGIAYGHSQALEMESLLSEICDVACRVARGAYAVYRWRGIGKGEETVGAYVILALIVTIGR